MPTYAYECERCGHRFELLQGISDPPRRRCPRCRGKVRRLMSTGGGLIFKGTGFYITDYKRKPQPEEKPAPTPQASPEKPRSGKQGENKPRSGQGAGGAIN